jgi:hypothetical protein
VSQVDKVIANSTAVVAAKTDLDTQKVAIAKLQSTANDHSAQLSQAAATDARLTAGQERMFTILKTLSDDVHTIDKDVGVVDQKIDDQALRISDLQQNRQH